MTKQELSQALLSGKLLNDLFTWTPGQECEIFKADEWKPGDEILYIADLYYTRLYLMRIEPDELDDVLERCYTGDDFLNAAGGDPVLAEYLFNVCDWQSPYTEADEFKRENAVEEVG